MVNYGELVFVQMSHVTGRLYSIGLYTMGRELNSLKNYEVILKVYTKLLAEKVANTA